MDASADERAAERPPRLTAAQRRWMGRRMAAAKGAERRRLVAQLAAAHGVTTRWLRGLRLREERNEPAKPCGRPRIAPAERERVRALVFGELEEQGWTTGWRGVLDALAKHEVSTMLVQQETKARKRERKAAEQVAYDRERKGHDVLARDAVWAQDATFVARAEEDEAVWAEVARDRASLATLLGKVGAAATGEDVVAGLERARQERGDLPLVWQSDRGSANRSQTVTHYLDHNLVIHLCSRVHRPTDNPAAEHANGEVQAESGLGEGAVVRNAAEAEETLHAACRRLHARRRASRGYRTSAQLDQELPRACTLVSRERFHREARTAMQRAVRGLTDEDERCKAEQDAVWRTLERHGIERPRKGRQRIPWRRVQAPAPTDETGYNADRATA